jgi:hypothetical protein
VLFFVTISRLIFTVLFRVIVIGKAKGCGFYLFGALLGCVPYAENKVELSGRVS